MGYGNGDQELLHQGLDVGHREGEQQQQRRGQRSGGRGSVGAGGRFAGFPDLKIGKPSRQNRQCQFCQLVISLRQNRQCLFCLGGFHFLHLGLFIGNAYGADRHSLISLVNK